MNPRWASTAGSWRSSVKPSAIAKKLVVPPDVTGDGGGGAGGRRSSARRADNPRATKFRVANAPVIARLSRPASHASHGTRVRLTTAGAGAFFRSSSSSTRSRFAASHAWPSSGRGSIQRTSASASAASSTGFVATSTSA